MSPYLDTMTSFHSFTLSLLFLQNLANKATLWSFRPLWSMAEEQWSAEREDISAAVTYGVHVETKTCLLCVYAWIAKERIMQMGALQQTSLFHSLVTGQDCTKILKTEEPLGESRIIWILSLRSVYDWTSYVDILSIKKKTLMSCIELKMLKLWLSLVAVNGITQW